MGFLNYLYSFGGMHLVERTLNIYLFTCRLSLKAHYKFILKYFSSFLGEYWVFKVPILSRAL